MQLQSWQLWALASAFFAGLTAIFGKLGVRDVNSNLATLIRTVVIGLFTVALVAFRGEMAAVRQVTRNTLLFLVLSGLATGCSWLCYYRALQLGPASKVAPVDKLSVVFAMSLAFLFLGEQVTLKAVLGGLLIVAGSLLMLL